MRFPSKCPHCNKDVAKNLILNTSPVRIGKYFYRSELHSCFHCSNPIFVFRKSFYEDFGRSSEIVQCFPVSISPVEISPHIAELSPNATKAYLQAMQARECGLDTLVGAGLRNALEWLMFDYLVKLKGVPATNLENKKLAKLIEMVTGDSPNQYTDICAKLIRIYGNDQIHHFPKTDLSVDEIISAFQILFDIIEAEIIVTNANNRLLELSQTQ